MASYRAPPAAIASVVDSPSPPALSLSPDKGSLLLKHRPALPSIAEIARPELKLAGIRFQPTFTRSRRQYFTGLSLQRLPRPDEPLPAELPAPVAVNATGLWGGGSAGAGTPLRIGGIGWSPDSNLVAFSTLAFEDDAALEGGGSTGGLRLAFADRRTGRAFGPVRLAAAAEGEGEGGGDLPLNAVLAGSTPFHWCGPRSLVALVATNAAAAPPRRPDTPTGPVVQSAEGGKKRPARTYQDLLKDAHDEATFRHYSLSSLVRVDLIEEGGGAWGFRVRALGPPPAQYLSVCPSPDNRFLLLGSLFGEASFLFPYSRFPRRRAVVRLERGVGAGEEEGAEVALVSELPLAEDIPIAHNSCRAGRRAMWWMEDAGARLLFLEACDGGDPNKDMRAEGGDGCRDRVGMLMAGSGFAQEVELARTELRVSGFDAFEPLLGGSGGSSSGGSSIAGGGGGGGGGGVALGGLLWEYWWKTRQRRCWRIDTSVTGDQDGAPPSCAPADRQLVWDYSYEDRYGNPGHPRYALSARGTHCPIVLGDGRLLLDGAGASKEGDVPFLDCFDMTVPAVAQQLGSDGVPAAAKPDPATGTVGRIVDPRSRRLFRSPHEHGVLERVVAVASAVGGGTGAPTRWAADAAAVRVITCRETTDVNPNYYIRDIALPQHAHDAPSETQLVAAAKEPGLPLTAFAHPYEALLGMSKRLCSYKRPLDGLGLTGTLCKWTPRGVMPCTCTFACC